MTGCPGVFAGGDMVPFERSVTVAVGHGKRAARHIDAWLSGAAPEPAVRPALATFDTLNTWYYADAPRAHRPVLDRARRESTFDEVVLGHDEATALLEARRCMSCGNCFGCDNCYGVCPDNAVIKLGEPGEATSSTSTTARAAASASPSARPARSRWSPRRSEPCSEVRVDPLDLGRLEGILPPERAETLRTRAVGAAEQLRGRIVWNVNATATGRWRGRDAAGAARLRPWRGGRHPVAGAGRRPGVLRAHQAAAQLPARVPG